MVVLTRLFAVAKALVPRLAIDCVTVLTAPEAKVEILATGFDNRLLRLAAPASEVETILLKLLDRAAAPVTRLAAVNVANPLFVYTCPVLTVAGAAVGS